MGIGSLVGVYPALLEVLECGRFLDWTGMEGFSWIYPTLRMDGSLERENWYCDLAMPAIDDLLLICGSLILLP